MTLTGMHVTFRRLNFQYISFGSILKVLDLSHLLDRRYLHLRGLDITIGYITIGSILTQRDIIRRKGLASRSK